MSPRRVALTGLLVPLLLVAACGSGADRATRPLTPRPARTARAPQPPPTPPGYALSWSADFAAPGALSKWQFSRGGTGWGLHQLQWYGPGGATVHNGALVISARRGGGTKTCWYGPCQYTSARLETKQTFSQAYGTFEARIKLPAGQGLWPAFWLEGANVYQVGWPACGEIDVAEPSNRNPYLLQAFAHAPGFHPSALLTVPQPLSAGFHTYAVTWTPRGITWLFDGHAYGHVSAYRGWPFAHRFFIILDLAVGGGYPGSPSAATPFPARMVVDWVRVYRKARA
jgi:beta-glucanase (GH16 family)